MPPIALDSETCLIRPHLNAPPLVCVSWAHGQRGEVLHRTDNWAGFVATAFQGFERVIGHNVAFDVAVWWNERPELVPTIIDAYEDDRVTDTLLRQALIDVAIGRAGPVLAGRGKHPLRLETLAEHFLGRPIDGKDTVRTRYAEVYHVPVAQWIGDLAPFKSYSLADTAATLDVYNAQGAGATVKGCAPDAAWAKRVLVDEYRQARGALWLFLSAAWSVELDPQSVDALEMAFKVERDGLASVLVNAGLLRQNKDRSFSVNTKVAHQRMVYAFAQMGLPVPTTDPSTRHPGGQVSLNKTDVAKAQDPLMRTYSAYVGAQHHLSDMVADLQRCCGPVREDPRPKKEGRFIGGNIAHPHITTILETGRTSYASPHLQNMPRDPPGKSATGARECLKARPGMVYLAADFTGFELATLAQTVLDWFGASVLANQLNSGIDPHMVIGAQILGADYGAAFTAYKAGDKDCGHARNCGKVASFGLPGGLSAETFMHYAYSSYRIELTLAQATFIRDIWYRTYHEMPRYFKQVKTLCNAGEITQARAMRVRGDVRFTSAANTFFQGPASDIAKDVGWHVMRAEYDRRLGSALYGCRTVLFVHDEYVLEVPEGNLGPAAKALEDIMVTRSRPWLPGVRLGCELMAMRRYSKKPKGENKVVIPIS